MKKHVRPHSDILHSCQVSQQTNVLGDTGLCYNVSVQNSWILKPNTKEKTHSQLHSGDPWSKAKRRARICSCSHRCFLASSRKLHEGRYQLNHSCILKDFSSLYLAHGNSSEQPVGSHSSQPGRTSTLVWSPSALSSASKNSQKLQLLRKHQCLAMPAGSGPWAMLLLLLLNSLSTSNSISTGKKFSKASTSSFPSQN